MTDIDERRLHTTVSRDYWFYVGGLGQPPAGGHSLTVAAYRSLDRGHF